jgi:hypothetical protein
VNVRAGATIGAAFVLVRAASVGAQAVSPECTVTPAVAGSALDICRKATDLFAFVVPQLGVALSGGNPVLGEGGTLGGWGKRSVTFRVTAVDGRLPANDVPLTLRRSSAVRDDFGEARTPLPMASIDAAIGVLTGIPMGVTNIGGVDLLIGATALPSVRKGGLDVKPEGRGIAISYGARLGVLQESSFVPGISVSYLRRKVPSLDANYATANDSVQVRRGSLASDAWRVVASKRFVLFGLAIGAGQDNIRGNAELSAIVNEPVLGTAQRVAITFPTLRESVTRTTAFANASLGVSAARLVVEVGRSNAGTLRETLNTFGGRLANEAYTYGSAGVTIRF